MDPLARQPSTSRPEGSPGTLDDLARAVGRLELLVVGDAILDVYLRGRVHRLAREAPVPVVAVAEREEAGGGAANAALNAAALGARVRLVSAVGTDGEGDRLLELLAAGGVEVEGVVRLPGRRTISKHRVVADGRSVVRFDEGTTEPLPRSAEGRLLAAVDAALPAVGVVLLSDYLGGVLTPAVLRALGRRGGLRGALLVADGRQLERLRCARPAAITPSYEEAAALLEDGMGVAGPERAEVVAGRAERLLALTGARVAAVTLDRDGALVVGRDGTAHRTRPRWQVHTPCTGAGDAFAAAFALSLAAGAAAGGAAELATLAATVAVERPGTAAVSGERLREELGRASLSAGGLVEAADVFAPFEGPVALLGSEPQVTAPERLRAR